jgi:hypothetical protein
LRTPATIIRNENKELSAADRCEGVDGWGTHEPSVTAYVNEVMAWSELRDWMGTRRNKHLCVNIWTTGDTWTWYGDTGDTWKGPKLGQERQSIYEMRAAKPKSQVRQGRVAMPGLGLGSGPGPDPVTQLRLGLARLARLASWACSWTGDVLGIDTATVTRRKCSDIIVHRDGPLS